MKRNGEITKMMAHSICIELLSSLAVCNLADIQLLRTNFVMVWNGSLEQAMEW